MHRQMQRGHSKEEQRSPGAPAGDAGGHRCGRYSPDLGDLRASLADDAAYELVGHRHLVSL